MHARFISKENTSYKNSNYEGNQKKNYCIYIHKKYPKFQIHVHSRVASGVNTKSGLKKYSKECPSPGTRFINVLL